MMQQQTFGRILDFASGIFVKFSEELQLNFILDFSTGIVERTNRIVEKCHTD